MGFQSNEIKAYIRVQHGIYTNEDQINRICGQDVRKGTLAYTYLYSKNKLNIQFLITYAKHIKRPIKIDRMTTKLRGSYKESADPQVRDQYKAVYDNQIISSANITDVKRIILEESIRIGSADAKLMAENIIFRLQL
jgi:hypothetical protein